MTLTNINNIDDCYKMLVVKDYWEQPSPDVCNNIVNFLDEYLITYPDDAKAYYFRSMAKFQLSGYNINNNDKICDDAFVDYNKAINIDLDIVSKYPNVRVIRISHETARKYYFRQPVNYKVLNSILGVTMTKVSNSILRITSLIFIVLFIYCIFKFNYPIFYFFCASLLLIVILFLLECFLSKYIYKISAKKAEKYCEEVVGATYDEWHG